MQASTYLNPRLLLIEDHGQFLRIHLVKDDAHDANLLGCRGWANDLAGR